MIATHLALGAFCAAAQVRPKLSIDATSFVTKLCGHITKKWAPVVDLAARVCPIDLTCKFSLPVLAERRLLQ
jgi:hypothetical protein